MVGSCKGQQSPAAITRSQLRTFGQQRVAGAIPDLRPSLDSDQRTTLITGVGSSLQVDPVTLGTSIFFKRFLRIFDAFFLVAKYNLFFQRVKIR